MGFYVPTPDQLIPRHKTAMYRTTVSRPMRLAIEGGLIDQNTTVFDYGCGRGADLKYLEHHAITANGWDPTHRPNEAKRSADLVNLGYVVNVIEHVSERADTLKAAWGLAQRYLVVAARLTDEADGQFKPHKDGFLTSIGTFQKFYEQAELRAWLEDELSAKAIAAAPGVFFIFRHDEDAQVYLARRYRRRAAAPKVRRSDYLFDQHQALLEPLMDFYSERGRLPTALEFERTEELHLAVGSFGQAWQVIKRVTGTEQWAQIEDERRDDLLMYLALSRFDGRPKKSQLAPAILEDVRALFGTYKKATETADAILMRVGSTDEIEQAIKATTVGKTTPNALYVHASALDTLPLLLRLYEGCARGYIGAIEDTTLIKFGRDKFKVSYLSYPTFDKDAHPALQWSMVVPLQTFRVKKRRYDRSENPPVLHRKELFVRDDYPKHDLFARLTRSEERAGLLSSPAGLQKQWREQLMAAGYTLKGHRLVKRQAE